MLVLARKVDQAIWIGPDVRLMVTQIDRNTVRIGIDAPRDMVIVREELIEQGDPCATASTD